MRKVFCFYFALFAMLTSFAAKVPALVNERQSGSENVIVDNATPKETLDAITATAFTQLSLNDLQDRIHRKLTAKEKISWWLFKKKFIYIEPTEREKKNANTNAVLGFIFGILSLTGLSLLAAIPGVILSNKALLAERADPGILRPGNKGFATAGQIMSYVGFALALVALILIIAFLSNFH